MLWNLVAFRLPSPPALAMASGIVTGSPVDNAESKAKAHGGLIPLMAEGYRRGLLVPFLGAGTSAARECKIEEHTCGSDGPGLALWTDFVANLERVAGATSGTSPDPTARAAAAVRSLTHSGSARLVDGVRRALTTRPCPTPAQLAPITEMYWPLVLTTNYDDLYVAAVHDKWRVKHNSKGTEVVPLEVLGRSDRDCQEVLGSLRQPARPILWTLQGYVGGQAIWPADLKKERKYADVVEGDTRYEEQVRRLHRELVVGHAEYRRVALRSDQFRRTFAEVWRSRSLLFLGSSLESYLLDLFDEIVELYGPSPMPHFAFMKKGSADLRHLEQSFGIWVEEFDENCRLPARLSELAEALEGAARDDPVTWSSHGRHSPEGRSVSVVTDDLAQLDVEDGQCIVFSAGRFAKNNRSQVSRVASLWLEQHGVADGRVLAWEEKPKRQEKQQESRIFDITRHEDKPEVFAIVARLSPWGKDGWRLRPLDPQYLEMESPTATAATMRDLRLVEIATREMLKVATSEKFHTVHCMLLAAGRRRTFPQSSALLQMVRGWERHCQYPSDTASLVIHLQPSSDEVLMDLRSGRLDLDSALETEWMDYWVEIDLPGQPYSRYLRLDRFDATVLNVARAFDIHDDARNIGDAWKVDVRPVPSFGFANWSINQVRRWEKNEAAAMTLERIGLLPGSILRFSFDSD